MTQTYPYLNFRTILKALAIGSIFLFYALAFNNQSFAAAGINRTINFQGKVVNKTTGTNVTNNPYDFTFRLYSASSGGSPLWTENWTGGNQITVTDGIFRANLGSVTTFASAGVDFNSDVLYLEIDFNGQTFTSERIRFAAVPYAFNAEKVSGLTVTNNGGNTLNIAASKTFTVSNTLTFTGTDSTSFAFPTTSGGTVITSTAPSQTVTSAQTSGTVLGLANSATLVGSITGLNVALTSSTVSQNKTGISFDLSGGTGGTYYDLLGSGSTWSLTRAGVLTVASCSGCGGAGGAWTVDQDADNWSLIDLGTNITARDALTITSGGTAVLTLDSASGTVTLGTSDSLSIPGNLTLTGSFGSNFNFLDASTGSAYNINGSDATGATNAGGALTIRAGNGGATSGDGGSLTFAGGTTNSGTAGYVAFQAAGAELFRIQAAGTFLFEKGASTDVILAVTAASGGDRTLTIPQLTADDTIALVTKTQTLVGKTLTSPTIGTSPTAAGATWTDLGTVTTADINGGTVDGATIGGASAGAGTFTALGGGDLTLGINDASATITTQDTDETLTIDPNGTGAINFHGSSFSLTSAGVLGVADLTLGTSDTSATLTTADTDENLTIDPNGTGTIFFHGGTYGITSTGALTVSSCSGCGGGDDLWNDGGTFSYLDSTYTDDLVLGGATVAAGSFFFDESAALLYLGNDDTDGVGADTGENGGLTFYSSGNVSDPTISVDASGNLTISAPQTGASLILGDGSGNIELTLTGAGDVLIADKTVALGGAYSATDYTFKRVLTSDTAGETQGGMLFYITDTGAASSYTADAGLLVVNSALTSGTFTGNLLDLQVGGTSKAKINYQGLLTLVGGNTNDILSTGTNTLKIDTGGAAGLTLGGVNANAISIGTSGITTTVASGLTLTTGRTLTVNADAFTDLTGNGLVVSSNALTVQLLDAQDSAGATSSRSGLEFGDTGANELTLLQGCATGEVLKWNETGHVWECGAATSTLQQAYDAGNSIETGSNAVIITETTAAAHTLDLLQLTANPATSGTFGGDILQLTMDAVDASGFTGDGLKIITDISQIGNGGQPFVIEDDTASEYFSVNKFGFAKASRGYISYDGYMGQEFNLEIAQVTADNLVWGDDLAWVADEGTCQFQIAEGPISASRQTAVNDDTGCFVFFGIASADAMEFTNTLNRPRALLKIMPTLRSATAHTFAGLFINPAAPPTTGGTSEPTEGVYFTNAGGTTWTGRVNPASGGNTDVSCSGGTISTTQYATLEIIVESSTVVRFKVDIDASDGIDDFIDCGTADPSGVTSNLGTGVLYGNTAVQNGDVYIDYVRVWTDDPPIAGDGSTFSDFANVEESPLDILASADLAEAYLAQNPEEMTPGTLVSIDDKGGVNVRKTNKKYDKNTLGVISYSPGQVLGQQNDKTVPLALSGRVPVNISLENGEVKIGDYLTSSSVPGVAMKATKAGTVIGKALEPYIGDGYSLTEGETDQIMMFIEPGNYNGEFVSLPDEKSTDLLNRLISENGGMPEGLEGDFTSQLYADRIVAQEVIAGKVVAQEIATKYLKNIDGKDLILSLSQNGSFIVKDESGKDAIKFDSKGNATFAGIVTADKIRANQIEGMEVYTDKVSSLDDKVALINSMLEQRYASEAASASTSAEPNSGSQFNVSEGNLSISGLLADSATVSGSLRIKGNSLLEGILTVIDTLSANNLIASGLSTFFGEAVFKQKAVFEGDVVLSKNMGGTVSVKKGQRKAVIKFQKAFEEEPIVNVNIYTGELSEEAFKDLVAAGECSKEDGIEVCEEKLAEDSLANNSYVVTKQSKSGFIILLKKEATADLNFSWTVVNIGKEVSSL